MNTFKLIFKSILYIIVGGSVLASLFGAVLGILILIGKVYNLMPSYIHRGLAWLFAGSIIIVLSIIAGGLGYELISAWKLKIKKWKSNNKGYTLMEFILFLVIIGIAMLIANQLLGDLYDRFIR